MIQLNEFNKPSGCKVAAFDIGYQGLVAAVATHPNEGHQLILWRMNSPSDITYLHSSPITVDGDINMKMDEEYIGIFIKQEVHCLTYYISMKTLQVESSTPIDEFDEIIYEKGYLIVYRKKKIG